jgi:hypothetical protein
MTFDWNFKIIQLCLFPYRWRVLFSGRIHYICKWSCTTAYALDENIAPTLTWLIWLNRVYENEISIRILSIVNFKDITECSLFQSRVIGSQFKPLKCPYSWVYGYLYQSICYGMISFAIFIYFIYLYNSLFYNIIYNKGLQEFLSLSQNFTIVIHI